MIDPLTLKDDIFAIVSPYLGTYTFPDSDTGAAIAIIPDPDYGWNYPENGTKVTGLEVVIKQPYPDVSPNIGGDRTKEYVWEIHLKQWDTNKDLRSVIDSLTSELSADYLIERVSYMPPSDKLLTVEQCKVFIKVWAMVVSH